MKMLVFDLDGTLLDGNRNMPLENINYLNKLKRKGYIIVIATGRTLLSACDKLNNIKCVDYIISDTGGKIYDLGKKEFIYKKSISNDTAFSILNLYNDNFRYIDVCSNGKYYKYSLLLKVNDDIVKTYKNKQKLFNDINGIDHIGINFKNNKYATEMYNYIKSSYNDINCIITQDSFSDEKWLEILPKNTNKYNAISQLAIHLNIPNERIMAFGDGLNDIEMLEKCGYGVAMANALNEVKKKSNYTTKKSNEELGVIDFLKEYLND